jgi:hypothetical protein
MTDKPIVYFFVLEICHFISSNSRRLNYTLSIYDGRKGASSSRSSSMSGVDFGFTYIIPQMPETLIAECGRKVTHVWRVLYANCDGKTTFTNFLRFMQGILLF